MKTTLVFLAVFAIFVSLCSAQTFQYSRGWTNGKRSVGVDLDSKVRKSLHLELQRFTLREFGAATSSVEFLY